MGNGDNGGPMARDVKWIIGTIVATGIGVVLVVSSLARHEATHVWRAMEDHERRVNDSANGVIMELQMLLHTLQDDRRERMGDVEDKLSRIRRSLDALRDSSHGTTHGVAERLHRIAHELTEIRRLADPVDFAESSAETLENIRQELAEIRRRLPDPAVSTDSSTENVDDSGEPSTDQTTEQDPEAR